jgi:23S rRNA (guanosine2251-2'-O)-methyltransferase
MKYSSGKGRNGPKSGGGGSNRGGHGGKSGADRDRAGQGRGDSRGENRGGGGYDSQRGDARSSDNRNQESRAHDGRRGDSRYIEPRQSQFAKPQRQAAQNQTTQAAGSGRVSLWGIHAVREAWLNPERKIRGLYLTEDMHAEFEDCLQKARSMGLDRPAPSIVERRALDRMTGGTGAVHQGIGLDARPLDEVSLDDLIAKSHTREQSVIVILDQVTDPHNVGAIMRSSCAFDAIGIIMQRRHAPELDGVLVKTASGAAEHIDVAYETNLSRSIEQLQEEGFFVLALDERGESSLEELPRYEKVAIVMGAEGPGIRRLVKEHCDMLVKLPCPGPVPILNVSNATAVSLYALTTAKTKS